MSGPQTIGQIADARGVHVHQINYLVDKLKIQPVSRAGRYRLFDADAAERIGSALRSRAEGVRQ